MLRFLQGQIAAIRTDKSDLAVALKGAVDMPVRNQELTFTDKIQNEHDPMSPCSLQSSQDSRSETRWSEITAAVNAATVAISAALAPSTLWIPRVGLAQVSALSNDPPSLFL
jgi:hypothetical protein